MNIHEKVSEKLEECKKVKIIYWIAWISGIIEEILKRRRRTSLAVGAIVVFIVSVIIAL